MIKNLFLSLAFVSLFLPIIVWAQDPAVPANFKALVDLIIDTIFTPLTLLIIASAVVMFLWGLVQYITKGGEGSKEAVSLIFWGVVILFVMISVWGLVGILTGTFGFGDAPITPPTAEF